MKSSTFSFKDQDGVEIFCHKWVPDSGKPKAVVQYSHGMTDYASASEESARVLSDSGYVVYADDHRGHGKTGQSAKGLGFLGPNGWNGTVQEIHMLTGIAKKENPGLPVFLIGMSWGSHLSQDYIQQFGVDIAGVILWGTSGGNPWIITKLGTMLVNAQVKKYGLDATANLAYKMTFTKYNNAFKGVKTNFDWLSRDEAYVKEHAANPLCTFIPPNEFYKEYNAALKRIWTRDNEMRIPKELPVFFQSGSDDMVNSKTKTLLPLVERYKRYGIKDVQCKIYPGARHVIEHELNKQEVLADTVAWLDAHAATAKK